MKTSITLNTIVGISLGLAALASLGGCGSMSARDRDMAVGAGVGAVGGAILTGGSTMGTVGGAAVGGIIGNEIGKRK